jgi:hypothetical protein
MVMNVLPNVTVENSGNHSMPPPPVRDVSFWEAAWNSFTGMLEAAWNAVVAVATFIANVALAVIKWCIDFAVAIAEGRGLQFFYDTVVKPFVEALLAFIKWLIDLFVAIIKFIFSPLINAYNDYVTGIEAAAMYAVDPPPIGLALDITITAVFVHPFVLFITVAIVAVALLLKGFSLLGLGRMVSLLIYVLSVLYFSIMMIDMAMSWFLADSIAPGFDDVVDWTFTAIDFVLAFGLIAFSRKLATKSLDQAADKFIGAALGLIILGVSAAVKVKVEQAPSQQGFGLVCLLDLMAWGLAFDLGGPSPSSVIPGESPLLPIANALDFAAKATSVSSTISDTSRLITYVRTGR